MPSFPTDEFVQAELDARLHAVADAYQSSAIAFHGDLTVGVDTLVQRAIQDIPDKNSSLVFVLTTNGGFIDVTQRIVETIRHHFDHVSFVIPDVAYSAGTVLAMSGDRIYMNYFSRLGPIDPQVESREGRTVPALGYLRQYERLVKKARKGTITLAEIQVMLDNFDQAELFLYEQAAEQSVSLLKKWLAEYKFKDWKETETRKLQVDDAMRTKRAKEIAKQLTDTERWHSHGHGISPKVLRDELNVKIDDFDADPMMRDAVRSYHELMVDYLAKTGQGAIHVEKAFTPLHF